MAFSPNGKRIVCGSSVWDAGNGDELLRLPRGSLAEIVSVAYSPDGKRIVGGNSEWVNVFTGPNLT